MLIGAAALQLFDLWAKPDDIQPCDGVVDEGCDDVGCFRVRDGVLAIGVQQHFVETPEDGVCLEELPSLGLDRLFEAALLSRMISAQP